LSAATYSATYSGVRLFSSRQSLSSSLITYSVTSRRSVCGTSIRLTVPSGLSLPAIPARS